MAIMLTIRIAKTLLTVIAYSKTIKMKKLTLLFLIILTFGCQRDEPVSLSGNDNQSNTADDTTFIQNFGDVTTANFIGRITDANGNNLSGVQITIGNATTITDHHGIFILNNVSVYEKFAYVKAFKSGYLNGSRTIVPVTDGVNDIQITLLQKNVIETIGSGTESEVLFNDIKTIFPGDFVDENGYAYSGQVEVSMHYLAPNREETFRQMPGSLLGQTTTNDAQVLETYGMIAVDLFSPSGDRLNIAEGSPATVEFTIDADQLSIAPETINLWHFDDEVGYWKEEGEATRIGNKYMAEMSHFSWWNYDIPRDFVTVCFNIISEVVFSSLPNNYVEIIFNETGQIIFTGTANELGQECGRIPVNSEITIIIYGVDECEDHILYQEVLGPFSTDTTVDITVPVPNILMTNLTGTVNNCDGNPVTNGYAFFYNETYNALENPVIIPITDGTISYNMTYCDTGNVFNVIIYDLDTGLNSGVMEDLVLSGSQMDLGVITICENGGGIFQGNVVLSNQEEIDAFGLLGYSHINGDLLIGNDNYEDTDIHDLSGLQLLTYISGNLHIENNENLLQLNGLESLGSVGSLIVARNFNLENLQALNNISGHVDTLSISLLQALTSLEGLENISSCSLLLIQASQQLESLSGLEGLTSVERLLLFNMNGLTSLSNLSSILITDSVEIQLAENLNSIEGLNLANQMSKIILNMESLESLEPLNNITVLEDLIISSSVYLTSLTGLNNLQTVTDSMWINSLNSLESLDGLENLTTIDRLFIGTSPNGSYSPNPVLTDFCALQNLFTNGTYNQNEVYIANNDYNPTVQDIINGNCSQ